MEITAESSCHGEIIRRILKPSKRSREIKHRENILRGDTRIILQNILDCVAARKCTENLGHKDSCTPDHRAAMADIRVDFNSFVHCVYIIPRDTRPAQAEA